MSNGNDRSAKGPSAQKTPAPHSNPHFGLHGPTGKIISHRRLRGLRATRHLVAPSPRSLSLTPGLSSLPVDGHDESSSEKALSTLPPNYTHACPAQFQASSLGQWKIRPGLCSGLSPPSIPLTAQLGSRSEMYCYLQFRLLAQKTSNHLKITTSLFCHKSQLKITFLVFEKIQPLQEILILQIFLIKH